MKPAGSTSQRANASPNISTIVWSRPTVTKASASASQSSSNPRRVTSPPLSGANVKCTNHLSRVGKHMRYLLIYDITEDRARTRLADLCLDYGLERHQYSPFCGDLPRTLQEQLLLKTSRRLQCNTTCLRPLPLSHPHLAPSTPPTFSHTPSSL